MELCWGGGLSYLADKKCPVEGLENILNNFDTGRLIQQSYYGTGEPPYVRGEFMGNSWCYNPVQGGDRGNHKSKLVDVRITEGEVYVKCLIEGVLRATGTEKVKGAYYSFAQGESTKNEVLTDALDADYLEAATEAARNAGLPPFVDVCLKARVSDIQAYADANDGEGLEYVCTTVEPAVKFSKPRKVKEETA